MTREEAIQEIDALFPADSDYIETNKIGIKLLEQAKRNNWRNLPDETLFEYARLCQEEDRKRGKFEAERNEDLRKIMRKAK